jgi:hypothetical protein
MDLRLLNGRLELYSSGLLQRVHCMCLECQMVTYLFIKKKKKRRDSYWSVLPALLCYGLLIIVIRKY